MANTSDPNSPEYASWYNSLPASTRAYAAAPGSAQATYQANLASAPGAATFQNSWMGQGQQPLSAGSGAAPNPLAKVGGTNTNTMAGVGGDPNGGRGPAPDMRNMGNGGNNTYTPNPLGGNPGLATLSSLGAMGGTAPPGSGSQPGSPGLVNPMARSGNNNTIIRPNPGMGIPTLNGAAKSLGGASAGTGASGVGSTQVTPNPLGTSNVVGAPAPSLTNPFGRSAASQATPGGPGSGIPPGNGLANTAAGGSKVGRPGATPAATTPGAAPGAGPLNFNLTYQDYLDYQKSRYGNASEGGGPANMTEDQWNALGQNGQWNEMGNGFAMQSNDPRYAAIAQQLGIKPGTTGPDGTIMFGTGDHPTNTSSAPGHLSLVDPNAALQGNGVWATAHPNLTPNAEFSGGGMSDKQWGIAALSLLGGGAALGTALGGSGAVTGAGMEGGGFSGFGDIAGSGLPGEAGSAGSMTGAAGNESGGGLNMGNQFPNGPPEAPPGGAGANGYGTPGGTPEQPFGPELPNVNSPTLDPMTPQGVNPLGATPASGITPGQVYNGARTALGGASLVNSLVNGGGTHTTPGKVGGPAGTPGGTSTGPGPGGSGDNSGGNDGGGDPNGTGDNGLPNWLNTILGLAGTGLGAAQENKNINTFKGMSNDLFNKGDYNQAYRPGYLDKLNKAFNDPDSLLQDQGYQNMRKDAMDNLSRQEAARGMSLSGNEMGDLTRLQSNMDYAQINNTRQQLMGAANLGDPAGMAKAQMLTLPFLFNAMNNRDASVGAAAGRAGGSIGNQLIRWLTGNNGGGGRNLPNLPGGGNNGGYPSGSGPSEKPTEVDENGNPIPPGGDDGGLPGPTGNGPNGPDGDVGNPNGPGGMDGGDPGASSGNGPSGDVGNPYGPGGEDGGDGPNWWDDSSWWD
jgi:hypothetical protein